MPLPRLPINLHQKVRAILQHTTALLPEAECPIRHFERSASVGMSVIEYILYRIDAQLTYPAVYDRHFGHLRRMVLAELLESFERFLKELASVCVVITHSDAMKLRMLVGGSVPADRRLAPTADDLRYVKRFLSETATEANQRVGTRLAELLEQFHRADPALFDAQAKANEVSQRVAFAVTISGHLGAD